MFTDLSRLARLRYQERGETLRFREGAMAQAGEKGGKRRGKASREALAERLRENLRRRKEQARRRKAGHNKDGKAGGDGE